MLLYQKDHTMGRVQILFLSLFIIICQYFISDSKLVKTALILLGTTNCQSPCQASIYDPIANQHKPNDVTVMQGAR